MQSIIRRLVLTVLFSGILATGVARAQTVIMDQIGPDISSFTGNIAASQQFESANSAFNIAAIDNFSATAGLQLVQVQALVGGFNGFANFSGVTAYRVEIYSSHAAAQTTLTGDIASSTVSAGSATVDTAFTGSSTLALVTLPINILLPSGVFYIAVIPVQDFNPYGQTGIGQTNYAFANPGGANGFQTNPGGGFGFGFGSENPVNADLGYRIFAAVPEPSSFVLVGATLIAFGWTLRRGHRKV